MKKLMFAAAAAFCGTVFALESANIVGYQTTSPTASRKNIGGVPFVNTDGSNLDIQSIVCKDGTSNPVKDAFKMWWYDAAEMKYTYATYSNDAYADDGMDNGWGTEYTDKFYWVTDDEDTFIFAPLGWKHDESAPATIVDHEKTFAAGEGFWIQPSSSVSNPQVTISGQVKQALSTDASVAVSVTSARKNLVTNPFPVGNYDIQDVVCKDGVNDPVKDAFKMWWYDAAEMKYTYATYSNDAYADDGMNDGWGTEYTDKFYWITDDEDAFIYAPLGWKHDENAPATTTDHEKTFAAGEGFWIQPSGVSNPQVTIAGQVKQALSTEASVAVTVTTARKNLVTNPFPVGNYDIQDVVCKDGANDPVNGGFKMWWYNAAEMKYTYAVYSNDAYADDGMNDGWGTEYTDKFYWITDNEDAFIFAPLGWKHDENAPATTTDHEKKFAAGEGFWIQPSGVSNPKVYFPNPFYKAAE